MTGLRLFSLDDALRLTRTEVIELHKEYLNASLVNLMEKFVVYRALYGEGQLWIRPERMFLEKVTLDGEEMPRFSYLDEIS